MAGSGVKKGNVVAKIIFILQICSVGLGDPGKRSQRNKLSASNKRHSVVKLQNDAYSKSALLGQNELLNVTVAFKKWSSRAFIMLKFLEAERVMNKKLN